MELARIYLRVSTDEQDLTRQAWRDKAHPKGTFRLLRITKKNFVAAA